MRAQVFSLLGLLLAAVALAEDLPSINSVDAVLGTDGKDTWGHISICVLGRRDRAVACFGLDKPAKEKGRYTYFAIFKHDPKLPRENHGSETQFNVEADVSAMVSKFDLGDRELTVAIHKKLEAASGKVLEETLTLDDQVIGKAAQVFVIDLSQDKLTIVPIKADLPKSVPDLADQDHKTWSAAIDRAIAEVKAQSSQARKLLE